MKMDAYLTSFDNDTDDAVICLVSPLDQSGDALCEGTAFFTTLPLYEQTGEDTHKSPWWANGTGLDINRKPGHRLYCVTFSGRFECSLQWRDVSLDWINVHRLSWLQFYRQSDVEQLPGGVSMDAFIKWITDRGGECTTPQLVTR